MACNPGGDAAADAGLVMLKGKWVEVDRAKLQTVLDHWKTLEAARQQGGVTFAEGLLRQRQRLSRG